MRAKKQQMQIVDLKQFSGHTHTSQLTKMPWSMYLQGAYKGRSKVLGFFWAFTKACSFVIITSQGAWICSLNPSAPEGRPEDHA
jgi:predicted MPP superfamily phosphohydrolase